VDGAGSEWEGLQGALERARARALGGWHRVVVGEAGAVERVARRVVGPLAVVYRVRLRPWLEGGVNPLEVLYPYRFMAREAPAGALAIVDDAEALYEAAHAHWRGDPLAARVVRRVLIGSRVPTLWCTPAVACVGDELLAQAPVLNGPFALESGGAASQEESGGGEFLVWARV
jgi:hypothetical protein